jgi:hypothetical protein
MSFIISNDFILVYSFFARGHVLLDSDSFCRIWQIIDYIFTANIIWCKAIFTLERYILVFYPYYLRSQQQKIIFHHIPLILINLYLILFYILVNLFCTHVEPQFNRHLCGDQCIDQANGLSTYNWIFNILFPAFLVILGSLCLLIRVLWTRREMQRNLRNWSKNWKMIIQLLSIAVIYTIVWLPVSIIYIISIINPSSPRATETIADHFYFLTYLCEIAVPVVALFFWPELMQKLRRHFRSNSIAPITMGAYSTN